MKTRHLFESAKIVSGKAADGTYKVRIIGAGQGSSGYYSEELLENYKDVWNGVPSYFNHVSDWESRDTRTLAGKIVGDTWTERGEDGVFGIYGNYRPRESAEIGDLFENFRDVIALSITASGTGAENDEGIYEVQAFTRNWPFTTVDIVDAAGAKGAFVEAARKKISESEDSGKNGPAKAEADQPQEKDKTLDEAKIKEIFESALTDFGKTLAATISEALKPTEAPVDEIDEAAVVEAALSEGLVKEQRKAVIEAVRGGVKAEDAIASQKTLLDSVREALKSEEAAAGRVGDAVQDQDYTVGRWAA